MKWQIVFFGSFLPVFSLGDNPDTADYIAIRQTLSAYPFAIDSKNFDALTNFFTEDVIANYSTPINVLNGLNAVKTALSASLASVHTQHALTTQLINIDGPQTASSKTYFTASHFGLGVYEGEILTAWGRYEDGLIKTSEGWRVKTRTLVYMAPLIGNASIFGSQ
ncbi:hypothetical protein AOQ84DRAFT_353204 [Glonium stellatum]|uniref:SnoaL-like domain-containing protein n=1 Tax=Glonium stellatum TaxID=574774 RepID=A0A8E2JVD9_9PEZI|nr:hypothetical protein AOQ84DRAFT_353204 [Glonium stellatum]